MQDFRNDQSTCRERKSGSSRSNHWGYLTATYSRPTLIRLHPTRKVTDVATSEDLVGINLVFQSVGTMAVLSARLEKVDTIVFTGNLVHSNGGSATLARFSELYDVQIVIPPNATYATAIGAALTACQ